MPAPARRPAPAPRPDAARIAGWWRRALLRWPRGSDEQVAALVNEYAGEDGFAEFVCLPFDLVDWRESGVPEQPEPPAPPPPARPRAGPAREEGRGVAVLRRLVRLLGKEGTKRLIDTL